jgi:hypothetical protein
MHTGAWIREGNLPTKKPRRDTPHSRVRRVLVVRNEVERRPHSIESHLRPVVMVDRTQPVTERLLWSDKHGAAIDDLPP